MVGVPGRSRGCNTCRKRKVKCSLETPICSVCTNSKRVCLGYARQRIFLQQDPSTSKPRSYKKEYCREAKMDDRSPSSATPETPDDASSRSSARIAVGSASRRPSPASAAIASPATLSLTGTSTRATIISTFLSTFSPHTAVSAISGPSAFLQIASLPSLPASLESALLALANSAAGRRLGDPVLTRQSLSLYVRSLGALSADLQTRNPRRALADETFAAAMLLVLYEVVECPDDSRDGFMKHLEGCTRLVVARGPEAHASGLGHIVFRMYRVISTLEALRSHKTVLAHEDWKTLPFVHSSKSVYDRLIDHLLLAPALLSAATSLSSLPPLAALRAALSLQREVADYDAALARFQDDMALDADADGTGPLYWEVSDADPVFPVAYRFRDTLTAATLTLLWGTRTIAWSGARHLQRAVRELTLAIEAELLAGGEQAAAAAPHRAALLAQVRRARSDSDGFQSQCGDFVDMARHVCRSVAYCTPEDVGARTVTAPLNMSLDVLSDWPGNEVEKRWIQDKLDCIQSKGMRIMKHLRFKE